MGCATSKQDADPLSPSDSLGKEVSSRNPSPLKESRSSEVHISPEFDPERPTRNTKMETAFDPKTVGSYTRHGIAPQRGPQGVVAKAKINQDRGLGCWPFNGSKNQAVMCVFDGHGMQGEKVSEWCTQQIVTRLEEASSQLRADAPKCMSQTVSAPPRPLAIQPRS